MSSSLLEELAQLRRENRALNEQVKKLVRAERSLALSQQVLDRQLHNVEVANQFALAAGRADRLEDIVRLALDVLLSVYPFEQGMGFLRNAARSFDLVSARALPGMEPPAGQGAAEPLALPGDLTACPCAGPAEELRRLSPAIDALLATFPRVFGPEPQAGAATALLVLPIRIAEPEPDALLVVRRTSAALSMLEELPGEADHPFLSLIGAHTASAMRNLTSLADAREAVRLRDEFLSIASHELRTPLTALALHLQALRRTLKANDAAERALTGLQRQYRRLATLVEQLLDVSRLRVGHVELRCEAFDLGELVREVIARNEATARNAGTTITLEAPDSTVVWGDPSQLDQVVTNLITNAVKFGQGLPVAVRLGASDERVWLRVSDRGIGIDEKDQARVFDRFERAVSKDHFGGLGLGLYIARQVVEAHGGTIAVESLRGQGATFIVELPRHIRATSETPGSGEGCADRRGLERVDGVSDHRTGAS